MHLRKKHLFIGAFFLFLFSFYIFLVFSGLKGFFILDDYPNLSPLSNIRTTEDIHSFVYNGISSYLGRPLSLYSFALQAEHWPKNPEPFKWIGLILHLFNAILIGLCTLSVTHLLNLSQRDQLWITAGISIFWLFLALHTSTVFYVIQRMTLLSAFFSLVGIYGFLLSLLNKNHIRGLIWATLSISIAYIAGILSKENAVLVGFYITILYFFIRPHLSINKKTIQRWDYWVIIFALIPPLFILGYLWISLSDTAYNFRSFTLTERLLTQNIILIEYLKNIFLPTPKALNIFNDGYPHSTGLLYPISTLFAVLSWTAFIILSVFARKKYPIISFAIIWFLAGHSLESSFWPLELYFEHRNYLPSLGPITAFVCIAYYALKSANRIKKWAAASLLFASFIINILINSAEIQSWSSPGGLAIAALTDRPYSLRARQEASAFFANTNDFATSVALLHSIEKDWPGTTGPYSQLRMLHCFDENIKLPDNSDFEKRLLSGKFDRITVPTWEQILNFIAQKRCTHLSISQFQGYLNKLVENPNSQGQRSKLLLLLAHSFDFEKDYTSALETINQLSEKHIDIETFMFKAQLYAIAGQEDEALAILKRAKLRFKDNMRIWLANKNKVERLVTMLNIKQTN